MAILAAIHGSYAWWLLQGTRYAEHINGGEIIYALARSLEETGKEVKKLLMGDSVGRQLYPIADYNDTLQSLACNQAISLAGHYFMLENFLKSHPPDPAKPYEVVLIYHPQSLINNLDEVFTYHYFVKNFYTDPYRAQFAPEVDEALKAIPYKWIARNPLMRISNWAPDIARDMPPILRPAAALADHAQIPADDG